jgi:hypothetical protein
MDGWIIKFIEIVLRKVLCIQKVLKCDPAKDFSILHLVDVGAFEATIPAFFRWGRLYLNFLFKIILAKVLRGILGKFVYFTAL